MKKQIFSGFIQLLFIVFSFHVDAQSVKVAVAANLQGVIRVLKKDFTQKTGITIEPIIGSSGNLSAQIRNGAPFALFLSADMAFPEAIYHDGFAAEEPRVYAYGSLIVCSTQNIGFENWERLLLTTRIKKIAIANPSIAPYGKAAQEALQLKGLWDDIKPKTVTGESIAQVNTYITTGVVDVGFTSRSLIKDTEGKTKLYWKEINPKTYTPIKQGMVLIKQPKQNSDAVKFYNYLTSPVAKAILKEYGYGI